MKRIKLSIIVPVYNEESGMEEALKKITDFLKRKNYDWEVIVVDDGSRDKTGDVVKSLNLEGVRLEKLPQNQGKGAAIRRGVAIAGGDYIIFTDADLSVPIEFTDKLMNKLQAGFKVVVGSRRTKGARIIKHQNFVRENLGRVFTFLSQVVTGTRVSDFTCGFKGFETKTAKKIFLKSLINRWVFDSEVIFLAKKFKYGIAEVPVEWVNREDSRIKSLGSAGYTSFLALMQIRLNDLEGKYD